MCESSLMLLGAIRAQTSRSMNSLRVCIMVIFYFQQLLLFRNSFIKKCFISYYLVTPWFSSCGNYRKKEFSLLFTKFQGNTFVPAYLPKVNCTFKNIKNKLIGVKTFDGFKYNPFIFLGELKFVLALASGHLFGWLLSPFDMKLVVAGRFLDIDYDKIFQTHFICFLPYPGVSIFPQTPHFY